ncbi:MAG TPA: DUF2917 domain-containing protein [Conexibacter sp.]|nr:DUF2917 domain-containing protein [Conexibacter sp.]
MLTLQPGRALALDAACGTCVVCIDGTLWLTQEGEAGDVLLPANHSWTARQDGRIVVQALGTRGAWAMEPSGAALPLKARFAVRLLAWAARLVAARFDPA